MAKFIGFVCCSFCNKPSTEVTHMVQSNNGPAICNKCIDQALKIIEEDKDKDAQSE
jgi:ATP-dependent protease Clp ATPase subunit